ncbi:ShlB/FhaC/HecB family hemolysin secretion/activation protein, partial [Serratia marcescens]
MKRTFLSNGSTSKALSHILAGVLFASTFSGMAATPSDTPERAASAIDAREQQRQQERERALLEQNTPQADARLSRPEAVLPDYPVNEFPCFTINRLTLVGESAARFQWAL